MLDTVHSKARAPIRLTDEPWAHITEEHYELRSATRRAELLAARELEAGKWLLVVTASWATMGS